MIDTGKTLKMLQSNGINYFDIHKLIHKKITELKGLISNEAALFIVSKDLGFEPIKKQKIDKKMTTKKMTTAAAVKEIDAILNSMELTEHVSKNGIPFVVCRMNKELWNVLEAHREGIDKDDKEALMKRSSELYKKGISIRSTVYNDNKQWSIFRFYN